jgi:phosphoribosyl 1,2-cyclic phosphate phosphodiesterase
MKIKFLGTGTSLGIPEIGCNCSVCKSNNRKNFRSRSSILINIDNKNILIDAGQDLRIQLINNDIDDIDLVLITHKHADHIFGLDDLRSINYKKKKIIPIYGNLNTITKLKSVYDYIEDQELLKLPAFLPKLTFNVIDKPFYFNNILIEPITVNHGILPILGYKIDNLAYVTDMKTINKKELLKLKNIEYLVINCLRFKEHNSHLTVIEMLDIVNKIKPKQTFLTHISHELDHNIMCKIFPKNIRPAFDNLEIKI